MLSFDGSQEEEEEKVYKNEEKIVVKAGYPVNSSTGVCV